MLENTSFAIVDGEGIIKNTIVIEEEQYIKVFNAKPLAEGQGIGDVYMSPEEYKKKREADRLKNSILEQINAQ